MSNSFGRECKAALTPALSRRERGHTAGSCKRGEAIKRKGAGQAPFDAVIAAISLYVVLIRKLDH